MPHTRYHCRRVRCELRICFDRSSGVRRRERCALAWHNRWIDHTPDRRTQSGRFGWRQLGLSVPIQAYEHGSCPLVGLGAKIIYSGSWMAALPLRLSYPVPSKDDLPTLYLQAGLAFHMGIPGVDVEAGLDWMFAAVFVGTTWLPDGSQRGATLIIGGRISLLFCAWALSCRSSGRCSPG